MSGSSKQECKRTEVCLILKNITNCAKKVAEMTGLTERTVYRMKKKLKIGGDSGRKPGTGAKRKLTGTDRRKLGTVATANPRLSNSKLASRLNELGGPSISYRTVGRELVRLGYKRKTPLSKPNLTDSHIIKRLEFCRQFRCHDWSKTIFSDEASFSLYGNSRKLLGKSQKIMPRPKYSPKFMVWGAISLRGTSSLKFCTR